MKTRRINGETRRIIAQSRRIFLKLAVFLVRIIKYKKMQGFIGSTKPCIKTYN
jgi:hypothetical protein